MQTSPWLNARTSPAICPKCKAPALHRSHTQSRLEEKRKHVTGRRPYRCHVCGYRGWFDETALRFPSSAQKPLAPGVAGKDVPVPDLELDDVEQRQSGRGSTRVPSDHAEGQDARAEGQDARAEGQDARAEGQDARAEGQGDRAEGQVTRANGRVPRTEEAAHALVNGEEGFSVPEFGKDVGSPVSDKVSPAFHHHARNKSHACPACGEYALYRSRARHLGESLRKKLGGSRPFRCHRCGWRGWMRRK